MRTVLSDFLARHRRPVLVTTSVLVVLVMVVASGGLPAFGMQIVVWSAFFVAMVLFMVCEPARPGEDRADVLVVADGGLATPRSGALVLAGVAHLLLIAGCFVSGVEDDDIRAPWLALMVACAAPFGYYGRGLWRGRGVTFTPQGLRADTMSGSFFVPWDAIAAEQPRQDPDGAAGGKVALISVRPELIVVTGWPIGLDRVVFDRTRRDFVAAAIRHYANHPDDRQAIGTASGYERLRAAAVTEAAGHLPPIPARSRRWIAGNAVAGGLIAGVAFLLFVWTDTRLDHHGPVLEELPRVLVYGFFFGVGQLITAAAAGYRRHRPAAEPTEDPPDAPLQAARPSWARDVTNGK